MERWQGKVAVVTGASAGIGLIITKQLVQHGLIVIGLARRLDVMKEGMKDVKGPGEFHAVACDVSNEQAVIDVFNWIKKSFKSVNILINNAALLKYQSIQDASTKDLEDIFKVNVFGILYCSKQAIPLMKENQTEAHIININSIAGHDVPALPNLQLGVYPASKFAVTALSKTFKNELSDTKIRVSNISPGAVETDMFFQIRNNYTPLSGMAMLKSEDVSDAVMYALGAPSHVEIDEIILQSKHM